MYFEGRVVLACRLVVHIAVSGHALIMRSVINYDTDIITVGWVFRQSYSGMREHSRGLSFSFFPIRRRKKKKHKNKLVYDSLWMKRAYVSRVKTLQREYHSVLPRATSELLTVEKMRQQRLSCRVACRTRGGEAERLVSGSDDFTLFLWNPVEDKKPLARLTGHQQPVNHLAFSPDGRRFASASFDKKVKVWDGRTGTFLATLNGHVGAVYQVAWSADSRLLVSASKDSTVKLWEMAALKR